MVNQADNINNANDRITISLIARLSDLPENQVGDTLTNTARVDFTGGTASDTAKVEVVGPALQLTKAADKATADAGDLITYTVSIPTDPDSTGAAYLASFTDTLGPGLALVVGSVTTTSGGIILSGNGAGQTAASVVFVALPLNQPAATITYQARVTDAAVAGSTIPNTANLDYSSWIDSGRPATPLTATATFDVPVPTLAKTITATGLTETGSGQFNPAIPDLALGETVTYRLTATLIEGTQGLVIRDALPGGLTPLTAKVISLGDGTNITGATLAAGADGNISGQNVTFDFGSAVVNHGDNSATNDTVIVMANGMAGNRKIASGGPQHEAFCQALEYIMRRMARMIVSDGERVTKFVEIAVRGAATYMDARKVAETVANSLLVKCSWNGSDPNWGRVMHAIGYSRAKIREEHIDIYFDGHIATRNGISAGTPLEVLKAAVAKREFTVTIDLNIGDATYTVYTSDLSQEYVDFNKAEYAVRVAP